MSSRIAIGTAQFGLNYGVMNPGGQVPRDTVARILELGWRRGCRWLDTAVAYGEAEAVLGTTAEAAKFHVSTKVGAQLDSSADLLEAEFAASLRRLNRSRPDVLLLHRSEWLRGPQAHDVIAWATALRTSGRVGAFGVSVYSPGELEGLELQSLDWVQVPLSVLAQDWYRGGHLERLRASGVRIQARSVLAQGLVVADPERLPTVLAALREPLRRLRKAAYGEGVSPLELALVFVSQLPIDLVVMGVESPEQLGEILNCEARQLRLPWQELACDHLTELDPRTWPRGLRIAS